jgi:hypothetical protein
MKAGTYPSRLSIPPVSRLESLIIERKYVHVDDAWQLKVIASSVSEKVHIH